MVSRRYLHRPLAYGLTALALAVLVSATLNESRASNPGLRNSPFCEAIGAVARLTTMAVCRSGSRQTKVRPITL